MTNIDNELASNWGQALQRLFPHGIPDQVSWTRTDAIVQVLRSIAAPNTGHMFFPDGGGGDLTGVGLDLAGLIELYAGDPEEGAYAVKIDTVTFHCPLGQSLAAYFLLDLSRIADSPEFAASSNQYREEFGRAGEQTYTFSEFMEGVDRHGEDIPADARRILRYWGGGKIAIFAKVSPYNDQQVTRRAFGFDAYEAYHLKGQEFEQVVQGLATALSQRR